MFGKGIPRILRNITGRAMKLYCLRSLGSLLSCSRRGEREGELLSPRSGTAYNIPLSLNTQPFARVYDISGEAVHLVTRYLFISSPPSTLPYERCNFNRRRKATFHNIAKRVSTWISFRFRYEQKKKNIYIYIYMNLLENQ